MRDLHGHRRDQPLKIYADMPIAAYACSRVISLLASSV
jgi:hypothetical protein